MFSAFVYGGDLKSMKKIFSKYLAHTKDGKPVKHNETECQPLSEHLITTASYAKERADFFNAGEVAELIGLLHDIGKYNEAFQSRIRGEKIFVQHAISGASILSDKYGLLGKYYGLIVASHHTGLSNYGTDADMDNNTYCGKLNNHMSKPLPYEDEVTLPLKPSHKKLVIKKDFAFCFATYLRMLFSVLVDSDFTDTEEFCTGTKRITQSLDMCALFDLLMSKMPKNPGSKINNIRDGILKNCLAAADKPQGLFSLTVPTGGGKTLSSLAFALKHAQIHGLRRVIYVIPYTSIIEQNAAVFTEKLGENNVFEHHSCVDVKEDVNEELNDLRAKRLKWASEDWNVPIIVTTNVQFFESLFAVKTTKVRKIHNITNTVVIFDEAQMLPPDYLTPCMEAISELIVNYGVTAVLCSATQPLVQKFAYKSLETTEIAANPECLSEQLKRVEYEFVGTKTDNELIGELYSHRSALVIVNTRKHAFTLYELVKNHPSSNIFYLSTLLTPADRTAKIAEIKRFLHENEPVIVISTQLIEAGVDVDFPVAYRSLAGIDSIIQAGGRVNREGKIEGHGKVIVFEASDSPIPPALRLTASIGKEVIDNLGNDAFGLGGIKKYFELLHSDLERNGVMDKKGIMSEFEASKRGEIVKMNFENAAKNFQLIEDNTISVVIPSEETKESIKLLRCGHASRKVMRLLNKHSVNVYTHEFSQLRADNAVETIDSVNVLVAANYYSSESGLDIFTEDNKNAECVFA